MSNCRIAVLVTALLASTAASAAPARAKFDPVRGHRWELQGATVSLYAIGGDLIREVRLPGAIFTNGRDACPPDMLVAPRTGELIVASNANHRLWRVHPSRRELQVYDIEVSAERDKDFGFAGLAWGASEKTVYARSSVSSKAWRIDLERETATPAPPESVPFTLPAGCLAP